MKNIKHSLCAWLKGDLGVPLKIEGVKECKAPKAAKPQTESDKEKFIKFQRWYKVGSALISALILAALMSAIISMPEFGSPTNPTENEVPERYVGMAEEETGATNVIAGMILNYRGFDTFGESCVLFLAVCCVMLLLRKTGEGGNVSGDVSGNVSAKNISSGNADSKTISSENVSSGNADSANDSANMGSDLIMRQICKLTIPCVLTFGIYILLNGHVSPGGGFSGGSVLGAALILFAVALGDKAVRRFFTNRVFDTVRVSGLLIYAGMFGVYIFLGANGIDSELSRYIVLVIDLAVGLVVMSTMYGFYSFYVRGEL